MRKKIERGWECVCGGGGGGRDGGGGGRMEVRGRSPGSRTLLGHHFLNFPFKSVLGSVRSMA